MSCLQVKEATHQRVANVIFVASSIIFSDCSEPQVQWLSSLTAPTAAHLEIEIMGVSVLLEQDPQARQRSSDDSKVEPMKPSTVGTGVIVWVG